MICRWMLNVLWKAASTNKMRWARYRVIALRGRCHVGGGLKAKEHDENRYNGYRFPSGDQSHPLKLGPELGWVSARSGLTFVWNDLKVKWLGSRSNDLNCGR